MRHISQCLNPQLRAIVEQAQQLGQQNEEVLGLLPEELKPYCQVSRFDKGRLVLLVSDPVWSCQLRYLLPQLRDQLRQVSGFQQLTSINLQVCRQSYP